MSDDKSKAELSLEELLKDSKSESYELTNEDKEWLHSSVGKEVLDLNENQTNNTRPPVK